MSEETKVVIPQTPHMISAKLLRRAVKEMMRAVPKGTYAGAVAYLAVDRLSGSVWVTATSSRDVYITIDQCSITRDYRVMTTSPHVTLPVGEMFVILPVKGWTRRDVIDRIQDYYYYGDPADVARQRRAYEDELDQGGE